MAESMLKRPTIWTLRGTSDPIIRSTFLNDTEITAVSFYYATSATALDAAWTALGDTSKPGTVTDPYVSKTHSSAGFVTSYYYRARMITAAQTGPWSNVVQSNVETFIYHLRDAFGLLRGVQLVADTASSTSNMSWFEAMEIALQAHNALRETLSRLFSSTSIAEIWANPPTELVQYLEADIALKVLSRVSIESRERQERLKVAREAKFLAESDFLKDGTIELANGETIDFVTGSLRLC
jgi:hypothetical protein